MAYKFTLGSVARGDINFEDDLATKIDFEDDYIGFKTDGNTRLVVSGSKVGAGISAPTQNLHVYGDGDTTLRVQGASGYYGALNVHGIKIVFSKF